MTDKLILHIGTHKTGTTTLQSMLESNSEALAANGFTYPAMPLKWKHAHINRNAYWLSKAAYQRLSSKSVAEAEKIAPCRKATEEAFARSKGTVILSDERLWYNATRKGFWPAARAILEECGARNITVVLYLRRQDLFAESLWMQYVKNSRLQEDLSTFIARKKMQAVCDYAAGVKKLHETFGPDKVIVRVYDRSVMVGGDTVADFLDVLGIDDTSAFACPESSKNPSLSPSMALLKLQVNRSTAYGEAEKGFLANAAVNVSINDDQRKGSLLSFEQRSAMLERYAPGNEWVAHTCLGREDGVLFPASEDELRALTTEPDALKLALQTCELMAEALTAEREQRRRETAALRERLRALEAAQAAGIGSRAKRAARKLLGR